MIIYFQTFRLFVCALISTTACVSLFLGTLLTTAFLRPGFGWLLVIIEVVSVFRTFWSTLRQPIFSSRQCVASETISLFALCPFQLIILLVVLSGSPQDDRNLQRYAILQGFSATSSVLHLVYTLLLVVLAALTSRVYDAQVWLRNIEAFPSPFPLDILFARTFPRLACHFARTRSLVESNSSNLPSIYQTRSEGSDICSKQCLPSVNLSQGSQEKLRPPPLPHTLVRIPSNEERKAVVILELPIRDAMYV